MGRQKVSGVNDLKGTLAHSYEDTMDFSCGEKSPKCLKTGTLPNMKMEEMTPRKMATSCEESPVRSVTFVAEMQDETFEGDEEMVSEILRSNSFSNSYVQTYHSQGYNTFETRSTDNSLFSSNVCCSKSQTLPCETNRSDSEYTATSFNSKTRPQHYLNSSLNSSVSLGKCSSKSFLKGLFEDNEILEDPERKRAYSMNTLLTNQRRNLEPGELTNILYTASNGKRLPRASVNDLRYILKTVSSSKSDSLNRRNGTSQPKILSGHESGSIYSNFVEETEAENRQIISKSLLIVDQLLGEVSAALRNLNQSKH